MSFFQTLSEALRSAAVSRRSRLDFVPSGHLMRLVRQQLFGPTGIGLRRWSTDHLIRVVTSCAERECEEAVWLLSKLREMRVTSDDFGSGETRAHLAEIIAKDGSARALFYRAQLSRELLERSQVLELLERAANGGFAPAMTVLAQGCRDDARWDLFRRAAALHDPDALNELAEWDAENEFTLHLEAATLGNVKSMRWLSEEWTAGLAPLQRAVWGGRAWFLDGEDRRRSVPEIHVAVGRMSIGGWSEADVRLVHDVGREREGVGQLWGKGVNLSLEYLRCIDFYLLIVHSARRSALQTVLALRERGVMRDVAIMIARLVYDSRDDAVAWCVEARKTLVVSQQQTQTQFQSVLLERLCGPLPTRPGETNKK